MARRQLLVRLSRADCANVPFVDETKIKLKGSDGRKRVYREMHSANCTLLNRLYGVWHLWLFTWYFRFQNKCNRNKFAAVSRWMSGFYIKQIYKECHWTPFYPPITLRGREYYFPVVRMFLRAFSPKQLAETSVHRATHPPSQKWLLSNYALMYYYISLPNNLKMNILYGKVIAIAKLILFAWEMCN